MFALKPTWGAVSREGLKHYSVSLDTLTWFGRSVADLALLCDIFAIEDDTPPRPVTLAGARFALCRSPVWDKAQPGTPEALETMADRLRAAGASVTMLDLPDSFNPLQKMHETIMFAEGRAAFLDLARRHPHELHDDFRSRVENRTSITRAALLAAYDHAALRRVEFDAIAAGFDAVLTPSARGEAPPAHQGPGDAVFNRMWSLLHAPCVNLPCCTGPSGMPVGVTLVTRRFADRQLLEVCQAVAACLP